MRKVLGLSWHAVSFEGAVLSATEEIARLARQLYEADRARLIERGVDLSDYVTGRESEVREDRR